MCHLLPQAPAQGLRLRPPAQAPPQGLRPLPRSGQPGSVERPALWVPQGRSPGQRPAAAHPVRVRTAGLSSTKALVLWSYWGLLQPLAAVAQYKVVWPISVAGGRILSPRTAGGHTRGRRVLCSSCRANTDLMSLQRKACSTPKVRNSAALPSLTCHLC